MNQLQPKVAIVILNWNGRKYLEEFLPAVLQTQYENLEIIVADNGSDDDSVPFLLHNFPGVRVIQLNRNFGFAGGYNQALKEVSADYFAILNSDVKVTPGWIKFIIKLMEGDRQIVACQPKILSLRNTALFEYAGASGGWMDQFGYPFCRGRVFDLCEPDLHQYEDAAEIFWASGAAMITRAKEFNEAGGFDPYFFAHQEEIDLCWRFKNQGYKIFVEPKSVVYHLGGGTLGQESPRKLFLNFRNNLIMMYKNLGGTERFTKLCARMVLDGIAGVRFLLTGQFYLCATIVKAHFAFYKWIAMVKKGRFQKTPMKNLTGVFGGSIVFNYYLKKKKLFSEIVRTKS